MSFKGYKVYREVPPRKTEISMISKSEVWLRCWEWWNGADYHTNFSVSTIFSLFALSFISFYILLSKKASKERAAPLPPGPRGIPLLGNLPFLEGNLHSSCAKLAATYGSVTKFHLGSKLCIVFSSPSVAKEVLKDQDINFANRDMSAVAFTLSYGGKDLLSPFGEQWRMLRKLCVKKLINHATLKALYGVRRREVVDTLNVIYSKSESPVTISQNVFKTMFNIVTSMMWGSTLGREEKISVIAEFQRVVEEIMGLLGEANVSDFFPVLAPFDLQGKERRMKKNVMWFDRILTKVIDRRRELENSELKTKGEKEKDFLQILLQLIDQGDQKTSFTLTHLKALLLDMLVGGTKTISTTVEWGMAELMKHPTIMKKLKRELEEVVGMNNIVEESHLPKLLYLEAVVKEVMRLHPAGPLLFPRYPTESCVVGGYMIPKGATIFVNVWAIQRDPEYWVDPLEFRPERFLNSTQEWGYNGNDLRYFPFGSGRRICPGVPLAESQISYLLASFVHSFEWKMPEAVTVDLSETLTIELRKKIPLVAIPTPRLLDLNLYA